MWIFLSILAFIILLITAILLLPVKIIIKTDQDGEVQFLYKLLFKTYGEDPDPNNPILKTLKEISGVSRLNKEKLKSNAEKTSLISTINDSLILIMGLLKRLVGLLKYCTVKTLSINIVCADVDAAETALDYGRCYAIMSPILRFLHSNMNIRRRGENINITCDYQSTKGYYNFNIVLAVRFFRVLIALYKAAYDEAQRISASEVKTQKNQKSKK